MAGFDRRAARLVEFAGDHNAGQRAVNAQLPLLAQQQRAPHFQALHFVARQLRGRRVALREADVLLLSGLRNLGLQGREFAAQQMAIHLREMLAGRDAIADAPIRLLEHAGKGRGDVAIFGRHQGDLNRNAKRHRHPQQREHHQARGQR